MRTVSTKKILLFGVILISVFTISGCTETTTNTETSSVEPEQAILVNAHELIKEYEANEVAADNKYKGKNVIISGTIHDIGKDILDDPYITFASNDEMVFTAVQCMFKDKAEVANFAKGQKVTVTGRVDGKLMNVLLKDCELKK